MDEQKKILPGAFQKKFLIQTVKILIYLYIVFRIYYFFSMHLSWSDRIAATIFILAEIFILIQALGYFSYLLTVIRYREKMVSKTPESFQLKDYPPVAVVVASYKEPLSVIEDTLICFHNLHYPNKQLYFLDDTRYDKPWDTPEKVEAYRKDVEKLCEFTEVNLFRRKWHHAKAGMINDFLEYLNGSNNPEFKLIKNQKNLTGEKPKYLIIFDADMNPLPDFIEYLVAILENDPKLAFIQTPQYYTNFKANRVAKASSLMQVIFYEFICEAKGIKNIVIICGTNVIIRLDALNEVGGIDLTSVTEDFATAIKLHRLKWKSIYVNKVCAFGMGPEDLGAFFKQQHRWALGTVGLVPHLIKEFIKNPFQGSFTYWSEYFLSASYYLIGWVYLVLMLGPVSYILFDFNIYLFPPVVYMLLLLPYNILANYIFYSTLGERGYKFKDLFVGITLGIICTPIYMDASLRALLGMKGHFVVTPKGQTDVLPLKDLWQQIVLALICFITCVWGGLRLFYEHEPFWGLTINIFWSLYYFVVMSFVFYFNAPERTPEVESASQPAT